MPDRFRLEDLERRVSHDPASIAFAQLAEEYRRAGRIDDAVRVCRAGLEKHPTYGSARVTLARALIEMGQHRDAKTELEQVVREAPDNLVAIRVLSELRRHWSIDEPPRQVPAFEPSELDLPDGLIPSEFVDGSSSFLPDAPLGPIDDQGRSEDPPLPLSGAADHGESEEPPRHLSGAADQGQPEDPPRHLSGTTDQGASEDRLLRLSVTHVELPDPPQAGQADPDDQEPAGARAAPAREEQALRALESWLNAILRDRSTRS
ncbi:MAG TPA: tetratricopeptide repeat protein [Vicinamibacterales bacterium]|nr:tetratricopeptide repeat protein [Vicinamibacterales bacterium]